MLYKNVTNTDQFEEHFEIKTCFIGHRSYNRSGYNTAVEQLRRSLI